MNKRMAQFSSWLWLRTAFLRSGAGLTILAVALVGLRWWWIQAQRPAHVQEIAAAYGSLRTFYGPAGMNHDGSKFIYVATADDRGRALFLGDTASGTKQQIMDDTQGVRAWNDDFDVQAGPWSPDDRYFLCCVSNQLMVCTADTNQEKIVIDAGMFSGAVWLTPTKFACVMGGTSLIVGQKRGDGQWERRLVMNRDVPMTSLTAIGPDTVAWLENGEVICRANLLEGNGGSDAPSPNSNNGGAAPLPHSATGASQPPTNGLALWLDASTLQRPNQEPVLDLPDLSRNKNDAMRNGTPPVFNAANSARALNGKGTIHFNWLNSAATGTGLKTRAPLGITGAAPRSVFVVMRHEANRPMMVSLGDTSAHGALFAVEWGDQLYLPTGWWADNNIGMASTDWNLLAVVYDGSRQKGFVNGVLRGTANAKLNTAEKEVEIGYRDATGGQNAKAAEGDFAELLVYNRALNYDERAQVEDYLNAKWFGRKSVAPQSAVVTYDTGLDGMTGLAGSKETGQLLISRTENGQDSVWRLDTASGSDANSTKVMEAPSVRDLQWVGRDKFVYASREAKQVELVLADLSGKGSKPLLERGNFDWFKVTPDQKQVFLFGAISNEPAPGIWRYDLSSDAWHPVISSSDSPSIHAPAVVTLHRTLKLPGGNVTYAIYRAANFDRHKKHPLVLGDTLLTDPIYSETFMTGMAACGATVAVVERPWWPVGLQQWEQNVQALYEQLKQDPTVDTQQVYLFAAGDEVPYMCRLVEPNPAPWRGLIETGSGQLPDFSDAPRFQLRPKILVCFGELLRMGDQLDGYQQDMLPQGALVDYVVAPGETMRYVGEAAKRERIEAMERFIFE
ncbi:MAG TPA: LamG-like jellyroll fold domain-containing protein, partial [Verrucomicrobiae bacterium]